MSGQTFQGHTPGPWRYQEESDAYTHIVRAGSRFLCQLQQDTSGEAEANARLMAASPDLLAENERLRADYETKELLREDVRSLKEKVQEALTQREELAVRVPDLVAEVERLRAELIEVRELLGRQRDACGSAVDQLLAAQRRNEDLQTRLDFYDRQAEGEAAAERDALAKALVDADSGLRYIMARYGALDGVGWERVFGNTVSALRAAGRLR